MKNRKILVISTVGLIYDGITNVILSNLEVMDKDNLDIYVANTIRSEMNIKKKFEEIGCKIVDFPNRQTNPIKYFLALTKFIRSNGIDVVHANGNSTTLAIELLSAKIAGCGIRVAHSHNTKTNHELVNKLLRPIFNRTYNVALACGTEAGKWLYQHDDFTVIKNGRDVNKYKFNEGTRIAQREKLKLDSALAIGHVGGFVAQKNQEYLIDVFKELVKFHPNAKLFLMGDGQTKENIEQKVIEYNLAEKVIFTGNVDNVEDYLQALDVMVLPSLFEGVPLVAIEWQLNGLPLVMADTVTKEVILSDETVAMLSLSDSFNRWAHKILDMSRYNDRSLQSDLAIQKAKINGFDIRQSAKILRKFYIQEG